MQIVIIETTMTIISTCLWLVVCDIFFNCMFIRRTVGLVKTYRYSKISCRYWFVSLSGEQVIGTSLADDTLGHLIRETLWLVLAWAQVTSLNIKKDQLNKWFFCPYVNSNNECVKCGRPQLVTQHKLEHHLTIRLRVGKEKYEAWETLGDS